MLYERWAVTVQVVECSAGVRMRSWVGKRTHAHCSALGKALLAFQSDDEIEAFVRRYGLPARTAQTITDPQIFLRHLREIRERGYAVDNEEVEDGLRCVAAPIVLPGGPVVAAVSVSGPAWRLTPGRDPEMVPWVQEAASRIASALQLFCFDRLSEPLQRHRTCSAEGIARGDTKR